MVDRNEGIVIVPAGRYYLCDPCYAVRDEDWMPWLQAADYTADNLGHILYGLTTDGFPVFGFNTAHGDGCWTGSDGFRYGADAGMIGLVPVGHNPNLEIEDTRKQLYPLVNIVEFDRPTRCRRTMDGVLTFGKVRINTGRW
jgi:hypothetical protein